MKIKKVLSVALASGLLALGASAVAIPTAASAHTPSASATCSDLTVGLENYDAGNVNTVSIEIDSTVVENLTVGKTFTKTYPLGDKTIAHNYVVTVDAPGTQYDRTFTGSSVPCAPVVPIRPAPISDVTDETFLDCDTETKTTTTTTTTTDWVLDVPTNTWVKAPPVVTVISATVEITPEDCPMPEVPVTTDEATPPTTPQVGGVQDFPDEPTAPTAPRELAATGFESDVVAPIGLSLLLVGFALVLAGPLLSSRKRARD